MKILNRYSETVVFENFLKDYILIYDKGPLYCASVYHSVMKLSRVTEPDFFLSEITELLWLELAITQTHFDSPFEFKQAKFYCIYYLLCFID